MPSVGKRVSAVNITANKLSLKPTHSTKSPEDFNLLVRFNCSAQLKPTEGGLVRAARQTVGSPPPKRGGRRATILRTARDYADTRSKSSRQGMPQGLQVKGGTPKERRC